VIQFFHSDTLANAWMEQNPYWKPVALTAGTMSGSLFVLFEPVSVAPAPSVPTQPVADAPRRRGRPPKARLQ